MSLRFVGIDPDTPENGSPTIWVDEETGELVIQGWKEISERMMAEIIATGPIPDHEIVLRLPPRMIPILLEACGVVRRDV
jgi:hypothetical protein